MCSSNARPGNGTSVARSVEVRLLLENPEYAIKPGLFAQAELYPEPRLTLTLDPRSVHGTGRDRYAFVARDGRAELVPVQVRELDDLRVEVLGGLAEGDPVLVATSPVHLVAGMPIQIGIPDAAR